MSTEEFTVDSKPCSPPHMTSRVGAPGVYLLLDPDTPNWVIVDDLGREIIALCNSTHTIREITETLCKKYGEPYEESVEYVLAFANELQKKYFLLKEEFPPSRRMDKKKIQLQSIWINVTNRCNLQCIHCHSSSGLPLENELTTEEIFQVISEAAALGVKKMIISGGEPLLRQDILEILEYTSEHIETVILLTNGTVITKAIAEKLRELDVSVQVSLDGALQKTQDFIRGKGSWEKTLRGLKNLTAAGAIVIISMTLMKKNMDEITEMADLARQLGVYVLHFPILQLKGRAKENEPVVSFENEELVASFKKILEISKTGDISITMEKNFREKIEKMQKIDFCEAGCIVASISADGKVYPCAALHEDEFCAGNIREQQLKDIWEESEVLNRFKSFSVLDIPECRTCDIKFICGGGCHARKYFAYGQLHVPTPTCMMQKKIYWDLLFEKMKEVQMNF